MKIKFDTIKNRGPFTFENCGALFFIDGEVVPGPFVLRNESFPLNKKVKYREPTLYQNDILYRRNHEVPFNSPQAFDLCKYLHRVCFDGNIFGYWQFTEHLVRRYEPNVNWVTIHPNKLSNPDRYKELLIAAEKAAIANVYHYPRFPPRTFDNTSWEGISKRTLKHLPRFREEILLFQTQLLLLGIETHK